MRYLDPETPKDIKNINSRLNALAGGDLDIVDAALYLASQVARHEGREALEADIVENYIKELLKRKPLKKAG